MSSKDLIRRAEASRIGLQFCCGNSERPVPQAAPMRDSRPVPPPISDERIRAVGAAHYGTLMTEREVRFARAIIAARDAQWKGGV